MKQHITKTQLNELSEKSKRKLAVYVNTKKMNKDMYLWPLLSIGQLIEFLAGHKEHPYHWWDNIFYGGYGGEVELHDETLELCDALWEAVKEVLE